MIRSRLALTVLAVAFVVFSASLRPVAADVVDLDGLVLRLPDGWAARGARSSAEEVWDLEVDGANGALLVRRLDGPVLVAGAVRDEIRARLAAVLSNEVDACEIRSVRVDTIDGVRAWRIRCAIVIGGDPVEQLVWIVPGQESWLLAFSSAPDSWPRLERSFEAASDSVIVPRQPTFAAALPVFGVAGLAGLARLVGRFVKRRRGVSVAA